MLASDPLITVSILLAVLFTFISMISPTSRGQGQKMEEGMILTFSRALIFPMLTAILWAVVALETGQLNNCSSMTGVCFSNEITGATTTTIVASSWDILQYVFYGFAMIFVVVDVGLILNVGRSLIRARNMRGRKNRYGIVVSPSDKPRVS